MQLGNQNMQMSSQTVAGNYQTIGLLFLSFEVFSKAVKKILEENSKPTASSWNLIFLHSSSSIKNIDFIINLDQFKWAWQDMDQETTGMLQTQIKIRASNLFCTSTEGRAFLWMGWWCQLWKGILLGSLFCLNISTRVYAYLCMTAKSQLPKQAVWCFQTPS